ncbi:MAG: hypothetical protein JST00_23840 [Deltaproteobacteria bacterium]|nr:hypothetical protein [Deltaproteobacteria bacterium]
MRHAGKRRALWGTLAFASAAVAWACVDSSFSEGQFACDPATGGACPPGLSCASDGRCRSRDVRLPDATVDAPVAETGPTDAGPDVDPCSIATWTVAPADRGPGALAVDDAGRLFVGGTAGDAGWIAELDACDGGTIRERVFGIDAGTLPSVQDIVLTGDEIVVTGALDDARSGFFARFSKSTFTASSEAAFDGGGGIAGFDAIARTSDGAFVLGGAKDIFAPTMSGWLARIDPGGSCTTTTGSSVAGVIPSNGDKAVVFTGTSGDKQVELRTIGAGCALGPVQVAPFPAGSEGGPSVVTGPLSSPVMVGAYGPKVDGGGYDWGLVGSIVGTTLTIAPPIDPNPGRVDIVQRAVVDGDQVFLAVLQNASLTGGTPTLLRYSLPLGPASKPTLTTGIFGGQLVAFRGMKTHPAPPAGDDALFIAGPKPGTRASGAITRCRKSTGCR